MSEEAHVYKSIEITGTSTESLEKAIENAVEKASETVANMRWFEVKDQRGSIQNGKIESWQVTIKLAFTLKS